jgi:hypothetical protein
MFHQARRWYLTCEDSRGFRKIGLLLLLLQIPGKSEIGIIYIASLTKAGSTRFFNLEGYRKRTEIPGTLKFVWDGSLQGTLWPACHSSMWTAVELMK